MAVVRRNTRSHCFCRWVIHGDLPKHIPNIRCLKCTANDEVVLAIQLVSPYCWWLNPIFCCLVKPPIFMVESNMFWLKIPWKKTVIMIFSGIWQLISASFMDFLAFFMDLTGEAPAPPNSGSRPIGCERRWKRSRRHPRLGSLGPNMMSSSDLRTMGDFWWVFTWFNGFLQIQKDSNGIQ